MSEPRHLSIVRAPENAPPLPEEEQMHGTDLEKRGPAEIEPDIIDGVIVEDEPTPYRGTRLPAHRRVQAVVVRLDERAPAVYGALEVAVTIGQGWHSWWVRAWSGLTHGVYRRNILAAEAVGDRDALIKLLELKQRAAHERHVRAMDLPFKVIGFIKVGLISLAGFLLLLVLLSVAVWATGVGSFGAVWAWVGGAIRTVLTVLAWLWPAAPFIALVSIVAAAWREGRRRGTPIPWLATSADADTSVTIDETTIARALGSLRIAQINAYLKQGLPLQFIVPARKDGRGTYAEVRLPLGVPAEEISKPQRRAALAAGLYRAVKETWPTTGSDAGILKLWIADKGALAEGAGPYPLLTEGLVDVFKGVPFGKTLRGDPIVAPLMERNTMTGGMPGQGKSSGARGIMAGVSLDPTAELRIWVPDSNFDFELFRPRCSRYVMGAEGEKIEWILQDLRELHEEVQARGDLLVKYQEPAVTRKLADAGVGLHPLICLLEEAHVAIQHKEHGEEIAQLLKDIVRLGRKRGIHMIVSTQAPTKDSMPRDVTRNCSNGIAFAVGDHVANDALLGQGAYAAGHRATELIPGVDKGTALVKGFSGERSDIVQVYFISIEKGNDQLTPIIERAMEAIAKRGTGIPGRVRPTPEAEPPRDLLEDLAEALGEETVNVADLPARLRDLAPRWAPYRALNGRVLRDRLAALDVKVPSTRNKYPVSPELIREALVRREEGREDES